MARSKSTAARSLAPIASRRTRRTRRADRECRGWSPIRSMSGSDRRRRRRPSPSPNRESPRAPTREPRNRARGIRASSRPSSRPIQGTRTFAGDPALEWKFSLSPGTAAGQFAAVRVPVSGGLSAFERVRFRVSASAPMRVWVQLRAPVGNTERWGATFYADTESRVVDVAFVKFNPIGETSTRSAPLDRVDSLLFVVDTLNSLPGRTGSMTHFRTRLCEVS